MRESETGNPIYNIFAVNASGGDLRRITNDNGEADILPQYSPDGNKISYYTYVWESGGSTHRIRIANADGSDEEILSTYPWEADPSWFISTSSSTTIPSYGLPSILISSLIIIVLILIIKDCIILTSVPVFPAVSRLNKLKETIDRIRSFSLHLPLFPMAKTDSNKDPVVNCGAK